MGFLKALINQFGNIKNLPFSDLVILVPALVSFDGEEFEIERELFSTFSSEAVDVEDEMAGRTDNEEFTT